MNALRRRTLILSAVAIAALILADEAAAQTLAARTLGGITPPTPRVVLRPRYRVRIESAWPTPPGETDQCNNRASETLEGSLRRVGTTRYEGRLHRQSRLGFCGTHGTAVTSCGAVLRGEGEVGVVAEVTDINGAPVMSLVWRPMPGTTRVRIEGSCARRFMEALERMYRDAAHSVDFPVPGEGGHHLTLEDYGRTIDIR